MSDRRNKERKLDEAVELTFPASDPIAPGAATATEPPARPLDRQAPLIRKEDIEQAQRGGGHKKRDARGGLRGLRIQPTFISKDSQNWLRR